MMKPKRRNLTFALQALIVAVVLLGLAVAQHFAFVFLENAAPLAAHKHKTIGHAPPRAARTRRGY